MIDPDPDIIKGIVVLGFFVAWWVGVAVAHFWFDYYRRFPGDIGDDRDQ